MTDPRAWIYRGYEFTNLGDHVGFVYVITNLRTERLYIGKKGLYFSKTKMVKKKKKRYKVESDWETYYGSNEELKADVEAQGPKEFRREILHLCSSKSQMTYYELKEQILQGALESDRFYNSWIAAKVRKNKNLLLY